MSKERYALHVVFRPEEGGTLRTRDGREITFKVPDDVSALESARFCELMARLSFSGHALRHVNYSKSIKAYGLDRIMWADDYGLGEIVVDEEQP